MTTDNERDIANASTAIDNLDLSFRQMVTAIKRLQIEVASLRADRHAMTIRLEVLEKHLGIRNIGKKNAD